MAGGHEDEPEAGEALGRDPHPADEGDRVEPVVDAATPEHHQVVLTDTVDDLADRGTLTPRRFRRDAEGDDIDEGPQGRVLLMGERVDPARRRQPAQPVIALLLAGTEEEVAVADLVGDRPDGVPLGLHPLLHGLLPEEDQHLQGEGVVEIDDQADVRLAEHGEALHHPPLQDDDAVLRHQSWQARRVVGGHREGLGWEVAGERRGQGDPVTVGAQHPGELVGADRRSRHPPIDVLVGEHEDVGHVVAPSGGAAARCAR